MRIAINTRLLLDNKLEGIGWFTHETLSRIVQWHPEHEFFFLFDRPYSNKFIYGKNVTPLILSPPSRHPILWYIWFEYSVKRALNKINADIFVSPDGYLSISSKRKSLAVIHDLNFEHFPDQFSWTYKNYYQHYFPKYAKKSDRIVTVSEYSKNDIIQTYRVAAEKIDVAYNGANTNFKPLSASEKTMSRNEFARGCNYFIYIGALLPRKNVARLLDAFDRYKEQTRNNIKLVIVGAKMFNTSDIENTYNEMKYKDEVIFTGRLAQDKMGKALGGALALTYVSYFEGFGIPLVEAMFAEVPIITSNRTSLPEVAGDAALIVDPFSVENIKDAMVQLSKDEVLAKNLVEKGCIQRQKFSWDNTAHQLWTSIEKTLNQ